MNNLGVIVIKYPLNVEERRRTVKQTCKSCDLRFFFYKFLYQRNATHIQVTRLQKTNIIVVEVHSCANPAVYHRALFISTV